MNSKLQVSFAKVHPSWMERRATLHSSQSGSQSVGCSAVSFVFAHCHDFGIVKASHSPSVRPSIFSLHPLYYSLPFLLFPRDQTSGQSPESQPTLSSTTLPGRAIKARVVVLLAHNTDADGEVTFSSLRWLLLFGVWTEGQSAPPSQLHLGLRSETPTTGRQRCLRASKTNRASGREKGDSGEGPSDRALLLALGRLCIIVSSNIHPITKREFRLRHHPISLSLLQPVRVRYLFAIVLHRICCCCSLVRPSRSYRCGRGWLAAYNMESASGRSRPFLPSV